MLSLPCEPVPLGGLGRNHRYQITQHSKHVSSPPRGFWGPATTTHSLQAHEESSGSHRCDPPRLLFKGTRKSRLGQRFVWPPSPGGQPCVPTPLGFRRPLTACQVLQPSPSGPGASSSRETLSSPPPPPPTLGLGSSQACRSCGLPWGLVPAVWGTHQALLGHWASSLVTRSLS